LPIPGCTDGEEAEAKAAPFGIKLLDNQKHEKVSIELDCANLTKALRSDNMRIDLCSVSLSTTSRKGKKALVIIELITTKERVTKWLTPLQILPDLRLKLCGPAFFHFLLIPL
jgi:hypothetical protein